MTERPRLAQREPRSLLPEQMGQLTVCTPAVPQRQAWVLCRGTGAGSRDWLDEAGRPGQVRSSTPPARDMGLGWCCRAGLNVITGLGQQPVIDQRSATGCDSIGR